MPHFHSIRRPSAKESKDLEIGEINLGYAVARSFLGQILQVDPLELAGKYAYYFDEVGEHEAALDAEAAKVAQVAKAMIAAESWDAEDPASFNLAVRANRYRDVADLCVRHGLRMSDFSFVEDGRNLKVRYYPQSNTPYLLSVAVMDVFSVLGVNRWLPKGVVLGDILTAHQLPYASDVDDE